MPNLTNAIKSIIDLFWDFFNVLNDKLVFDIFGFRVSFMILSLSCIVLGFVISIFWKGVKS